MKKNCLKKINFVMLIITFLFVLFGSFSINNIEATEITDKKDTVVNISEERIVDSTEGIFDTKALEGIYKVSEDKFSYLPFVRYALDRIIVDKEISGIGTMFSATNIEVNSPMTGLQVLFANDTVRVNSNMEYAIVFSANNTVIDGTIDKPIIVFAGQNITITENAVLNSDIICYANSLSIDGKVNGSVLGAAETIKINGNIKNDLRVQCNNIEIKNENNIIGNVYVETYNKELNIKDDYPNAKLKILETRNNKLSYDIVMNSIITCLLFTLVYIIIKRKTNGKIYEHAKTKLKDNILFVVLSGSITLLAMPAIILLLILFALLGLQAVAIPLLLIYVSGVVVVSLLSVLIVGSLLASYMANNYFKEKSALLNTVGTFFVFLSLHILAKLQYIGMYVTMALILLAVGIVITYIFKNNHKIVSKVEENN